MRARKLSVWLVAGAIAWAGAVLSGSVAMAADPAPLDDAGCLACHDGKKGELTVTGANGKPRPLHPVAADKFGKSVHARLQ
ncbi:MAG: cytochrome C, partial [Burkholderiales bacterium]|nr:cytochrome C [Burkholderiales bacterium]